MAISRRNGINGGNVMNKQQEKVLNETRIRNLKRKYVKCIDEGEIEDAIDLKLEIDMLKNRI